MTEQANTQQSKVRELAVDGIGDDGNFAGDGQRAPFVVFDVDQQKNIAGPFPTRSAGEVAMASILAGAPLELDATAMNVMLELLDTKSVSHHVRQLLIPQETSFNTTGDGSVVVTAVASVHKSDRTAIVNISTEQKYVKVSAVGGNDNIPTICICAADDLEGIGTEVELLDFAGWNVWSASASKYSIQVALLLN